MAKLQKTAIPTKRRGNERPSVSRIVTRSKKSQNKTASGSVKTEIGKVAVGNGGTQRTTRNSLRSAGVPDPDHHIFGIPTVDKETVEIDISQPQTVFAPVHVDSDPDPEFYAEVQEMVDDFLGHEATLNLFPDIVVHNRFSPLEEQEAEPEQTVEPEPEFPTPEGKRSRKKKTLCNLGYLEKTKKKQQLAKKRLMQRVAEKSRRTLDPTSGYGSLDEHSSDDEEEGA
jgi:hypothetical protein